MVKSAFGMSSSWNSRRNDGTAMPTRISTGMMVQATSISVLWVVLDGMGFFLALNFTMTITSSASTNSVMMVISQNRKLWNQMMFSITGVAASCSLYSQGAGWPISANAAPPKTSAVPTTANPSNQRPLWPIDIFMPLALLMTWSPQHARQQADNAARSAP